MQGVQVVEKALLSLQDKISTAAFGKLCWILTENGQSMPQLILEMRKTIYQWLVDEKVSLDNIGPILGALSTANSTYYGDNKEIKSLLKETTSYILDHFMQLTPN